MAGAVLEEGLLHLLAVAVLVEALAESSDVLEADDGGRPGRAGRSVLGMVRFLREAGGSFVTGTGDSANGLCLSSYLFLSGSDRGLA